MDKWQIYAEAKRLYEAGKNVSAALRNKVAGDQKRLLIEAVYDLQSGSYTSAYTNNPNAAYCAYAKELFAKIFSELGVSEVMDCGIGEATSWLRQGKDAVGLIRGFDVSLSRLSYAEANLASLGGRRELFSADLYNIPVANNSAGCVVTMHAIEPNGGMEEHIIDELVRISGRYLVIMEPDFTRATDAQKQRMQKLGYATRVFPYLLGRDDLEIHDYRKLEIDSNPLNGASLLVAEKKRANPAAFSYVSPITGSPLERDADFFYDREAGFAFPLLRGLPALKKSDAIFLGRPHPEFLARKRELTAIS